MSPDLFSHLHLRGWPIVSKLRSTVFARPVTDLAMTEQYIAFDAIEFIRQFVLTVMRSKKKFLMCCTTVLA